MDTVSVSNEIHPVGPMLHKIIQYNRPYVDKCYFSTGQSLLDLTYPNKK